MVLIKDRFTNGVISGIVASIIQNLLGFISYYLLHFAQARYLDFSSEMLFGHFPENFIETIFAQLGQIIFDGFLGIIFAMLVPLIQKENFLFKGWYFGATSWFLIFSLGILFKVPSLHHPAWQTVVSHFFSASAYGIVLAFTFRKLEQETVIT